MTAISTPLRNTGDPIDAHENFWQRIANELAGAIGQGVYAPGQRLPSEHALAQRFGVNRHTVRRSLASLCQQGLVRITQGSGTYVEEFALDLCLSKRTRHQQLLIQAGLRGSLQVLQSQRVRASAEQARALALPARAALLNLRVLGMAEAQPVDVGERYFPLPRFAGLDALLQISGSISAGFSALGVADYTRRESRITAQLPEPWVAQALRQPVSRPVLLVESVNIDQAGVPIEYATTWFAGDRVKLTVKFDEN